MSQIADHRRHALPKGWKKSIKSGMINAISLARYVAGRTRGEAAEHTDPATRSRARLDQYEEEIALLRRRDPDQGHPLGRHPASPTAALRADRAAGDPRTAGGPRLVAGPNRRAISGHRRHDLELATAHR